MLKAVLKTNVVALSLVLGLSSSMAAPNEYALDSDNEVTMARLFDGHLLPDQMIEVLSSVDQLVPSATIAKGDKVSEFELSDRSLGNVDFEYKDKNYDIFDFMALNRIAGMLILKDGKVVLEEYQLGLEPDMRWLSASMVKSLTSTLVGLAIADGHINSVDDMVVDYLPVLKDSGYDGVTIKQILQMRSGVKWDETYNDPNSDRRQVLDLQHKQEPGAFLEFMSTLEREVPAGSRYNYSTGETYLIGALVEAAVNKPLPEYLSERIWQPLGMERDGKWWLMSPEGPITAGGGYAATLRDYARFAQFIASGAVIDGVSLVPEGWFEEAGKTGTEDIGYGYQWWTYDKPGDDPIHKGAVTARGVYGQSMYINFDENLVIVILGAQSKTGGMGVIPYDVFHAEIVKALHK